VKGRRGGKESPYTALLWGQHQIYGAEKRIAERGSYLVPYQNQNRESGVRRGLGGLEKLHLVRGDCLNPFECGDKKKETGTTMLSPNFPQKRVKGVGLECLWGGSSLCVAVRSNGGGIVVRKGRYPKKIWDKRGIEQYRTREFGGQKVLTGAETQN